MWALSLITVVTPVVAYPQPPSPTVVVFVVASVKPPSVDGDKALQWTTEKLFATKDEAGAALASAPGHGQPANDNGVNADEAWQWRC